ncbi:MAG: signal peptidase II [Lachnospiraceae bacterium]|nr:signal peptidase II [Lachnospiraceae bacterium]MDD3615852.1 signal peptidase II [Lachnospiraceae bacterium]
MNKSVNTLKYNIFAGISFLLLVILDQWTKFLALRHLAPLGTDSIDIFPGVLELHYLENRGAAFGMFQNKQWFFVILSLVFFVAIVCVFLKTPKTKRYLPLNIVYVLLAAGAIGNSIDRIRINYVIDFVYFSLIDFPIFNVADIYVTCSVAALAILFLLVYKEEDFEIYEWKKKGDRK